MTEGRRRIRRIRVGEGRKEKKIMRGTRRMRKGKGERRKKDENKEREGGIMSTEERRRK